MEYKPQTVTVLLSKEEIEALRATIEWVLDCTEISAEEKRALRKLDVACNMTLDKEKANATGILHRR